jgi:hypothetical protein
MNINNIDELNQLSSCVEGEFVGEGAVVLKVVLAVLRVMPELTFGELTFFDDAMKESILRRKQAVPMDRIDREFVCIRDAHLRPLAHVKRHGANIVLDFIVKSELLVYGGMAAWFALQNQTSGLQNDMAFPSHVTGAMADWDVYSPDPIGHAVKLCECLLQHRDSFCNVHVDEAVHPNTYRIKANYGMPPLADLTYMPGQMFDLLSTRSLKDRQTGVRYVPPDFCLVNLYKIIINPLCWYKVQQQQQRVALLESLVLHCTPTAPGLGRSTDVQQGVVDGLQTVLRKFVNMSNVWLVGDLPFNMVMNLCNMPDHRLSVKKLQLICYDPHARNPKPQKGLREQVLDVLRNQCGKVHQHWKQDPFLDFFVESFHWVFASGVAVDMYVTDTCMPWFEVNLFVPDICAVVLPREPSNKKCHVRVGCFHIQMFFHHVELWHARYLLLHEDEKRINMVINTMQYSREKYLHIHRLTGTEPGCPMMLAEVLPSMSLCHINGGHPTSYEISKKLNGFRSTVWCEDKGKLKHLTYPNCLGATQYFPGYTPHPEDMKSSSSRRRRRGNRASKSNTKPPPPEQDCPLSAAQL